jgi:hypothetical protein
MVKGVLVKELCGGLALVLLLSGFYEKQINSWTRK